MASSLKDGPDQTHETETYTKYRECTRYNLFNVTLQNGQNGDLTAGSSNWLTLQGHCSWLSPGSVPWARGSQQQLPPTPKR